ncbi:unnamed protein product [Strongylus vulgaris]|uniref:Uncharacterized protein n=1 Tax=Strongylus vulgaris TaxID=40348 RepID=A0A3P7JTY3_STRVU|nr:unnamed protein product [Strongylus vulgaris]
MHVFKDHFSWSPLDENLANCFGADRNFAVSNYEGISGSSIAQVAFRRKVNNKIKTKIPVLYKELEHLYQLASAITAQRAIFENSNTADAYHVIITGLAGKELTAEERQVAMEDIKKTVDKVVEIFVLHCLLFV